MSMKVCLNNNKKTDFCAPLTSFDWNAQDPRLIATSSIDTTCSIWDIGTEKVRHFVRSFLLGSPPSPRCTG